MTMMDRSGTEDAETILHAQLDIAGAMVGNAVKSTKTYELMWGPPGFPSGAREAGGRRRAAFCIGSSERPRVRASA